MIIKIPVSLGELIDKISILKIKKKNIHGTIKGKLINKEILLLNERLKASVGVNKDLKKYLNKLIFVNNKLWKIEDRLREYERQKKFDQKFIHLARSVYITNDERSKIKLEINRKFGSTIIEIKSYKKY